MSLLRSANLLRRTPPALARGLSTSAPSMDVSRILLVGRLATHPTVRLSASGSEYAAYTVATRDPSRGPQDTTTSFHRIFAFGSNADRVRSLQKGAPVYVEADFRVERLTVEDRTQEKYLVSQRTYHTHFLPSCSLIPYSYFPLGFPAGAPSSRFC